MTQLQGQMIEAVTGKDPSKPYSILEDEHIHGYTQIIYTDMVCIIWTKGRKKGYYDFYPKERLTEFLERIKPFYDRGIR